MARTIRVPRQPVAPRARLKPVVPPPVTRTIADLTKTAEPERAPEALALDVIAAQIKNLDLVQGPLIGTEDSIVVRNGKAVRASTKQIADAGTTHDGGGRGMGRRAFTRNIEALTEAQAEAIVTLGADAFPVDVSGVQWTFDTSNVDADPGAGNIRFNNSTPALATLIYADNLDRFGNSATAWLDAMDDGGSAGGRGRLRIGERGDELNYAEYNVTGSVVDGTGYRKVTVAYIAGSLAPIAGMVLALTFIPIATITFASEAEHIAGLITDKAANPAGIEAKIQASFASEAEAEAGIVETTLINPLRARQSVEARVRTQGIFLADSLDINATPGDVDTFEAENVTRLQNFFTNAGNYSELLLPGADPGGSQKFWRVNAEIVIPASKKIRGWGHNGAVLKSNDTTPGGLKGVIRVGQLAQIRDLAIDSSTERRAMRGPRTADNQGHCGILVAGSDPQIGTLSKFQTMLNQVRVVFQPGPGVYYIGQAASSDLIMLTIQECGMGLLIDDGTFFNITTKGQQPGQFVINHLRAAQNRGPGFQCGTLGDINPPYRMLLQQAEIGDNSFDPSWCPPATAAAEALGANPIATTSGSDIIVITQAEHKAIDGNYVTIAGWPGTIDGLTTAMVNQTWQVWEDIDDAHFSVKLDNTASGSSAAVGGAGMTVRHIWNSQCYITGSSHQIDACAWSNPGYASATTVNGTAKGVPVNKRMGGGVAIYAGSHIRMSVPRNIIVSWGMALDKAGVASGGQPTSLSFDCHQLSATGISTSPTGFAMVHIPNGATGCSVSSGAVSSGSFSQFAVIREPTSWAVRAGILRRGLAGRSTTQWTEGSSGTPSAYTIASGNLTAAADIFFIEGEGDAADTLVNLFGPGAVILPAGRKMHMHNDNSYAITLAAGGNLVFAATTIAAGTGAMFFSTGAKMVRAE